MTKIEFLSSIMIIGNENNFQSLTTVVCNFLIVGFSTNFLYILRLTHKSISVTGFCDNYYFWSLHRFYAFYRIIFADVLILTIFQINPRVDFCLILIFEHFLRV